MDTTTDEDQYAQDPMLIDEEEDSTNPQRNGGNSSTGDSNAGILETKALVDLPIARVKRIMKSDVDVKLISPEAVLLVAKAAELLLEHLAEESSKHTDSDNRKIIQYKDVVQAVKECDVFDFLEDIVPERHNLQSLIDSRAAKR